jgi:hypothetical protein
VATLTKQGMQMYLEFKTTGRCSAMLVGVELFNALDRKDAQRIDKNPQVDDNDVKLLLLCKRMFSNISRDALWRKPSQIGCIISQHSMSITSRCSAPALGQDSR